MEDRDEHETEPFIGRRVPRNEDLRLLTGASRFVDDVVMPGMLHAAFVRSDIAHGHIVSIDAERARSMPGVHAVIVGGDMVGAMNPIMLAPVEGLRTPMFHPLATDKVRFVGEPVVLVVADDRYIAEDAADTIVVEIDELPAVVDAERALDADAPILFDAEGTNEMYRSTARYGDTDAAFARADRVVRERFVQHRYANTPMEGHACVSSFDASNGELTHHSSSQGPHMLRMGLAFSLNLPFNSVRVLCGDVGGAFGSKGHWQREELAVAFATIRLGRPIKWIADRNESLLNGGQTREETVDVEIAVTDDGTILGLRVSLLLNQGAYQCVPYPAIVFPLLARALMPSAYRIVDFDFEIAMACTNKAQYVAYRGPWETETWVRERLLDVVAAELGLDPVEIRRRNLWDDDELPRRLTTDAALLRDLTVRECLDTAVSTLDYAAFRAEQAEARTRGRHLGVGFSCFIEPAPQPIFGIGFDFVRSETARAQMEPDGSLTVYTSQAPSGQGHETTIAQACADHFGVAMRQVRVVHGDTRLTAFTSIGSGASRGATMAVGAALGAIAQIRRKVLDIAAAMLETTADELEIVDGVVRKRGSIEPSVHLMQIALAAFTAPFALPAGLDTDLRASYTFDYEGGWAQSCHCCVVEVDLGTGQVEIIRYIVAENCGVPIHPGIVEGQIRGGIAQGIGGVLYEHSAYDEAGQFLAGTFMDYLLPTSMEIPHIEICHVRPKRDEEHPHRGVGEGGCIGSPAAVTNAIEDALRPLGVEVRQQHLPPTRILELLGTID